MAGGAFMYSGKDGFTAEELKYLQLLSKQYKNINSAATEVMNLKAILNLPKGTEHFVSDIHGEVESFSHVLRNASGVIKNQISAIFGRKSAGKRKEISGNADLLSRKETGTDGGNRRRHERLV